MTDTETLDPLAIAPAIMLRSVDDLIPYARNSRTHTPEQVAQLAGSIEEFGFTNPILADEQGIVAGHGRVMAVRQLLSAGRSIKLPDGRALPDGYVPVLDCTGWSEAKRKAYIITDNAVALNSGWDFDLLKVEIEDLKSLGFDTQLLGFSVAEMDVIMNGWEPDQSVLEGAGETLEGIKAIIKIMVEPADEGRALDAIKGALSGAGIKFVSL